MAKQVKYDFNPFKLVNEPAKGVRDKDKVIDKIAKFIVDSVASKTKSGTSPVKGRGKFKKLTKEYAAAMKGGSRKPNLTLEGDMLGSLDAFKKRGHTMRLTVAEDENDKADGHNNHSGDSLLPERRFIPKDKDGETFKKDILQGIKKIIKDAK